jgi:hypothetical protein
VKETLMKRFRGTAFVLLALLLPIFAAPPAVADETFNLKSSGAQTGNGIGSTTDIGNWRRLTVTVSVTAGSGTVNPFRVWVESSPDGSIWYEIACEKVIKGGAAAPGSAPSTPQRDIVNETAVVTTATYSAMCEVYSRLVRTSWAIAGTTPSETFFVRATGK